MEPKQACNKHVKLSLITNAAQLAQAINVLPENMLPWQPYNAFSCTPKIKSDCVLKRTGR